MKTRLNSIEILPDYGCNMNCIFCYNSSILKTLTKQKTDINYSDIYLDKTKELIDKMVKDFKTIIISICGGEIMADFWEDKYLEHLYEYLKSSYDYMKQKEKDGKLFIILNTNLVHKKTDRWLSLINKLEKFSHVTINTSFDLFGRFNTLEDINTFYDNINIYKKWVIDGVINMIRTTESMRILQNNVLKNDLEYRVKEVFKYLYDNFTNALSFDEFVCNSEKTAFLKCSNNYRFETNKFLIDNYPKLTLYTFIEKNQRVSHCATESDPALDPQCKCITQCTYNGIGDKFIPEIQNIKGDFTIKKPLITYHSLRKMDCINCKYYKICPIACPMSLMIMDKNKDDICYIKQTIEYLKTKKLPNYKILNTL